MKEIFENVVYESEMINKILSLIPEGSQFVFLFGDDNEDAELIAKNLLIGLDKFRRETPKGRYLLHINGVKIEQIDFKNCSGEIIMNLNSVDTNKGQAETHIDFLAYLSRFLSEEDILHLLYLHCKEKKKELSLGSFKRLGKELRIDADLDKIWGFFNKFYK